MNQPIERYLKVGLVHYMAYPLTAGGEGEIVESVRRICADEYFQVIEVAWMKDASVRHKVRKMVEESAMTLTYGAHPRLLRTKQNINSLDETQRLIALANLKEGVDEAYELGAGGYAFLSGQYDEATKEESFRQLVASTVELCRYAKEKGDMPVNLSVFDYDADKCCLIGPAPLAAGLASEVCKKADNFGLLVDLTHIPLLHETIRESLLPVAKYLKHVHIGNSVIVPGAPGYGDQHPRFGFPGSANGIPEIVEFLQVLFEIGYLNEERPAILSFEVKPFGDDDIEMAIANAKRTLNAAWARM